LPNVILSTFKKAIFTALVEGKNGQSRLIGIPRGSQKLVIVIFTDENATSFTQVRTALS